MACGQLRGRSDLMSTATKLLRAPDAGCPDGQELTEFCMRAPRYRTPLRRRMTAIMDCGKQRALGFGIASGVPGISTCLIPMQVRLTSIITVPYPCPAPALRTLRPCSDPVPQRPSPLNTDARPRSAAHTVPPSQCAFCKLTGAESLPCSSMHARLDEGRDS